MKVLQRFFDFYINSSIHVGLAIVCLMMVSYCTLNIIPDFELLVFVFFGSVSGYNFIKYAKVAGLHHRSLAKSLRLIQVFSFLSGAAVLFLATKVSTNVLVVCFYCGVFTLLYALPFFTGKRNLRNVGGVKIFVVAGVWTGVTVLLPIEDKIAEIGWDESLMIIQRFMLVIVLTLPFELRDLPFDSQDLKTIPQQIGKKRTKILGALLIFFCFFLEFFKDVFSYTEVLSTLLISLLVGGALVFAPQKQPKYYASFWVESLPVIWLGLLLLFKML